MLAEVSGRLAVVLFNVAAKLANYDIKSVTNVTINIDKINGDSVDVTVISESEIRNFSDIINGKSENPTCVSHKLLEGAQLKVYSVINFGT